MLKDRGFARLSALTAAMIVVTVAVFVVEFVAAPGGAGSITALVVDSPLTRIPGNVLFALKRATPLSNNSRVGAETDQPITITIVLKRDDQKGFDRYLREVYDPQSSQFHKFLTQTELANRFGPSRASYDRVIQYMFANGFHLLQRTRNRLSMTMRGTRGAAERAFHVRIRDYRIGKRRFHANDRNPALPKVLARNVQAVMGMANLAKPRNTTVAILMNIKTVVRDFTVISAPPPPSPPKPTPTPTPCKINGGPNNEYWHECDGEPEIPYGLGKIGLLEFDNYDPQNVVDWLRFEGLPTSLADTVSEVNVNGGVAPGPDQSEVLLDIDTLLANAPGQELVVYDGPFQGAGSSFQTMFQAMINDGDEIISNSWAYCEDQTTLADVQSINSILQQAAGSGITVLNGAGDTGSTCLDGSPNTISVPADSPYATAVGGTTLTVGPGDTYQSEEWWNGAPPKVPVTGQGGYGTSKFFSEPDYQVNLIPTATGRSIPDVVVAADPAANGIALCWNSHGGCPNGLLYGGTSAAAPIWAAFTAMLDDELETNVGFLNPLLYPFANTSAFHSASDQGSTPQQVGLGSPNLSNLELALSNSSALGFIRQAGRQNLAVETNTIGPVDPNVSVVQAWASESLFLSPFEMSAPSFYIPADGTTQAFIVVELLDSTGHVVSGKTVTLKASSSNVQISPASGTSNSANGAAIFTVTDSTPEDVSFTATDETDSIPLSRTPTFEFGVPPATAGNILPGSQSEAADGSSAATITVTLKDTNGNPTPGKLVTLSQGGGQSVISAPDPSVTDSSGQISFQVTDVKTDTVTYAATDVTDGNLPVPGSASVQFQNGTGCAGGTPPSAPGYAVHTFAQGFVAKNFASGGLTVGDCPGASGMAFDSKGYLYVADMPTGDIYKFGLSGGVADSSTLLTPSPIGAYVTGLAFDPNGDLFASILAPPNTAVSATSGEVVQIDPATGLLTASNNPVASGLPCLWTLATDPVSGDLFTADTCSGGLANNSIWRVKSPASSPSTGIYASTINGGNSQIAFAPDGTMYVASAGTVAQATATNSTSPGTVSTVPNAVIYDSGLAVGGMQSATDPSPGDAQFLLLSAKGDTSATPPIVTQTFDLTTSPPATAATLTGPMPIGTVATGGYAQDKKIVGPQGCLYLAEGNAVYKITNLDGSCDFGPTAQAPEIDLTPTTISPNPAQGSTQTFTASLHYTSPLSGVAVTFTVAGVNPQAEKLVNTGSNGQAGFSYTGIYPGTDTVQASATINGKPVRSSIAQVNWDSGADVTAINLNQSPTVGTPSQPVTVEANLTDVSADKALSGQSVDFKLGTLTCSGVTDSNGTATCQMTPTTPGMQTLTANFAGDSSYTASSDSKGFNVVAPFATPTPTPVPGKLRIHPHHLNFGAVEIGSSKTRTVKIVNKGKVTRKKTAQPIVIEMESATPDDFQVSQDCNQELTPRIRYPKAQRAKAGKCEVEVTFAPTAAQKYAGTLTIYDNLEPNEMQEVTLKGKGKQPKSK